MQQASTEIWVDKMCFPECPRWHDGKLYFVDMYEGRIWSVAQNGKTDLILQWNDFVAGLGWLPCGDLLFVDMNARSVMRLTQGKVMLHASLADYAPGLCNDMVVDQYGTAFISNFGYDTNIEHSFKKTALIKVSHDGKVETCSPPLAFPNGIVISPEGDELIVAETAAKRIVKFSLSARGELSDRQVVVRLDQGLPDGICLDKQGAIWVAAIGEPALLKIDKAGNIVDKIETHGQAIACMLGGNDGKTLYITSAPQGEPTVDDIKGYYKDKQSGYIERVTVNVGHAGRP